MSTKIKILVGVGVTILIVTTFLKFNGNVHTSVLQNASASSAVFSPSGSRDVGMVNKHILEQRNSLSKLLNTKQMRLGQMECETKAADGVSDTGGWCRKSSSETGGQHVTDRSLVPALAEFFEGKYVASFGDGPGRYKQLIIDSGKVKGYDAYDGAPFCEDTSEGRVQYLDLTLPQFGMPAYDWILSLEVAEHIPKQFEDIYISNVVRHAKEGVILSWARLGQEGHSHVNNQPFEYVKSLMEIQGFSHDDAESKKLQNAASLQWLQWNTNVYRRKNITSFSELFI